MIQDLTMILFLAAKPLCNETDMVCLELSMRNTRVSRTKRCHCVCMVFLIRMGCIISLIPHETDAFLNPVRIQRRRLLLSSPRTRYVRRGCAPLQAIFRNKQKQTRERKTIHRPPYRLGGQPYLEHQHRGNATTTTMHHVVSDTNVTLLNPLETANTTNYSTTWPDILASNSSISSVNASSTLTNASSSKPTRPPTSSYDPFFSAWNYSTWNYDFNKKSQASGSTKEAKTKKDLVDRDTKTPFAAPLVSNKKPDDVLTVADLEAILRDSGYIRESDLLQMPSKQSKDKNVTLKSGKVAFPQGSVLSYRGLTIGTTVSSGFMGMILSMTVLPNLWLVGIIFGSLYGYEVSKDYKDKQPTNILARVVTAFGRKLAKMYLTAYDFFHGIWFMYKTGQLSYEYYKQYSKLDDRFGIGEKIDAWNARFQEGKRKFDQWEQQNEIGRRTLATLRTAWLVEEQSLKKSRKSKYRVVQCWYNVVGWFRRMITATWDALTGGGSSELGEILRGIRSNVSESRLQEIGPRLGAAMLALVTVTMVGAIYALAPKFLAIVAVFTGVVWPTWVAELFDRVKLLLDEFKARGRGEQMEVETKSPSPLARFNIYDKNRYFFYRREDGSKRWYRTGRPAFRGEERTRDGGLLGGTTDDKRKKQTTGKKKNSSKRNPQWGLFGS